MLKINHLKTGYGTIQVIDDLDLEVRSGQLVSLIGANGSGKTTTMRAISGWLRVWKGSIEFEGEPIQKLSSDQIIDRGIVQVPEGRKLFPSMTVLENLELGAFARRARKEKSRNLERVFHLFPILKERMHQLAGTMSGGQQQMLAIGRGLMANPKLLILDEPSIGLSPLLTNQVFDIIKEIVKQGITVLLVEQNANQALSLSDQAYVLENGKIAMRGSGRELLNNPYLRVAYLGR